MHKPPRSPRMPCHPLDIAEISCSKALQTWKNAEHLAEVERQGSEVRANVFLGACGHIKGIRKAMAGQSIANSLLDSTKSPICFLFHPEIAISCQQSHEERRVSLPTGPSPWLYFRKAFAIPHGKCWLNVIADFRPTYLENFRKIKSCRIKSDHIYSPILYPLSALGLPFMATIQIGSQVSECNSFIA